MKKVANTRIVFDRRNTASKKIAVPVYIEVTYDKVRNFYNTGVKVRKDQFRNDRVCNCGQQVEYNKTIDVVRNKIVDYINMKLENGEVFTLEGLKEYMDKNNAENKKDAFLSLHKYTFLLIILTQNLKLNWSSSYALLFDNEQ